MAKTKFVATVESVNQSTVSVLVVFKTKHSKYQKIIKRSKKYLADNRFADLKIDDRVEIEECSPLSKNKHFKVVKVIK